MAQAHLRRDSSIVTGHARRRLPGSPMIGRTLSHYQIIEEISRGGMGVVYRAIDTRLGREVALKVLPEDLTDDPERRDRLVQEARAASVLEHPNIAVIHAVDDVDGITFIAMELIRGHKLSEVLGRGPLSQARTLDLATEIAEGLARAHEKGIVHRDLKPANVMVTDEGHAKIIDFGLAKLSEPVDDNASTATVHGARTAEGVVLGTVAYMSPEQARGARIDHRSDVFSFGILLYEMATGRAAFHGQSRLDTLNAILTQPVPPLPAMSGASADATGEVQRIIGKCTAKDPDDRYQGMRDVVVDLRAARRRLESSTGSGAAATPVAATGVARANRSTLMLSAALAIAAITAGYFWLNARPKLPAVSPSGKPSVAVLYFENNTGDASLDWMRTGLADMMVTDLSQSSAFEVLGTDRVYQILQELKRQDDRAISADVVKAIAGRAAVDTVLIGSYVKAGDTIRISARLQEAQSGRIVKSERVDGQGEASLFTLIDELTRRFKTTIEGLAGPPPGPLLARPGEARPEVGLDRGLTDITTTSIEAYRYYSEGLNFHERGLAAQAAPLLEKALAIDPTFAMALAKLAVVQNNLGNFVKRDEYGKRAVEHVDRLTPRERYYIEGFYYALHPETYARSIEAYTQGLALHPEHQASRHNLALMFQILERFPEAIAQNEELIRRGTSNPTTYENLSEILIFTGDPKRAREVAEDFLRRFPESPAGLRSLGSALLAEGRLDEALEAFRKSEALNPADFQPRLGRRAIANLRGDWTAADAVSDEMIARPAGIERFIGWIGKSVISAAQGRGRDAAAQLTTAIAQPGIAPFLRAGQRNHLARLLLRRGEAAPALAQLELALVEGINRDPEFETLQFMAIAQAALGRKEASATSLARLEARAKALVGQREARRVDWARGEIALGAGDAVTAATALKAAQQALPPHGPTLGPPGPHTSLLYSAAVAAIKAGWDADAAALLDRLQQGYEHIG